MRPRDYVDCVYPPVMCTLACRTTDQVTDN